MPGIKIPLNIPVVFPEGSRGSAELNCMLVTGNAWDMIVRKDSCLSCLKEISLIFVVQLYFMMELS